MNPHILGHDLQVLSTVIGKTVTETGVVGQGQNGQLHPDFLFSPLHCDHKKTSLCVPTTLVHSRTIITFLIKKKKSWYQLNSRAL